MKQGAQPSKVHISRLALSGTLQKCARRVKSPPLPFAATSMAPTALAAVLARRSISSQSISSTTVLVGAGLPPVSCVHAGSEWRANGRKAASLLQRGGEGPALLLLLLTTLSRTPTILGVWLLLAACCSYVVARRSSRRDALTALLLHVLNAAALPGASAQAVQVTGPIRPPSPPQPCTSNQVQQSAPDVGAWGGTCTCPDGGVYLVGDNFDSCASLACVGGVSGSCEKNNPGGEHVKVTCGACDPAPPPPPASPPPPPLLPLPPLSSGFDAAASEAELRSLITEAAATPLADVSVYLAPGAHLKLSSQIRCASSINVTVASSSEGATLDGQGQTRLFSLSGGCSLTLRGLTLVNGKAGRGGVVEADGAGDVEIIDSTVRDCSARYAPAELSTEGRCGPTHGRACSATDQYPCCSSSEWCGPPSTHCTGGYHEEYSYSAEVRLVELAAAPAAPHGRGARSAQGHGCLTPLSPPNRSSAVSSTRGTAVQSR